MHATVGWINIYRSGFYHREGKPTAFDRHPGDIYSCQEDAWRDIDTRAIHYYVDTVCITWHELQPVYPNPRDSMVRKLHPRRPI